ncbi:MAG: hypothetical protein QE570_06055 [Verrucomicrobiota bacterium]|nr:hypothetical protein [Verrucomicrobiota bacterium]
MKATPTHSKKDTPQGFHVPMKHGKVAWPKQRKPPSAASLRKTEVEYLITALADAARSIGQKGIVDDYSRCDFHLYPRHIVSLFPKDHPKHLACAAMDEKSRAGVKGESIARMVVPWPKREGLEPKSANELREKPFEIIGLLMRKILDADSAFFEAVSNAVITARMKANQPAAANTSSTSYKRKRSVGKIVAGKLKYGMTGDPDWFNRIPKPHREGKSPYAIWTLCKALHKSRRKPPTRRDIREYLYSLSIPCSNLTVVLGRMNLQFLKEGPRRRKTNI